MNGINAASIGTFDYIIVGAGSAGCVLADRLTASGRFRVLLLEAGARDRNPWIHIPIGYSRFFRDPRHNWMYETEPEPELHGRKVFQPRGKVLGGSSSINGLVYMRGQKEDYDLWRQLGNSGWSFEDVLPYFRRLEDYVNGADDLHGSDGPIAVSDQTETHPLCDAFIHAGEETGLPRNDDFNGPSQEGIGYFQTTSRNGLRCSTAAGYLKPARGRQNLRVETGAHVTRIRFTGNTANGVEFVQSGKPLSAEAGGEVILCGGAFNSPQLLELSGIGQGERLQSHGIPIVHNAPRVGEELQDHAQVRMILGCKQKITWNDLAGSALGRLKIALRYALQRKGPMTVSAGYAGAFFKTRDELELPDIQVHFLLFSTDRMGEKLHPYSGFSASVCQLRPESRGSVHIRSSDPFEPPAIRANYLSAPADQLAKVEGLKRLRQIIHAPALEPFLDEELVPGTTVTSDDDLLDYCRGAATTIYHPVGTCAMGPAPEDVLTSDLRVNGVDGLRVVDGSVMPRLVSGNTNVPIIMIAEKASDMILRKLQM